MKFRHPQRAIVLAAGAGVRMYPLSAVVPKPVMPVWGTPLLQHTLQRLEKWGVREVLINLHHRPESIVRCAATAASRLRINFSFEPEILGTGGVLRRAEWFLDRSPFWIVNSDVLADVSPMPFMKSYLCTRALAVLWLHPNLGPRTVEMTNGAITSFRSSRPGTVGTYTLCGLHLVSPRIRAYLPPSGFLSILSVYERAMSRGERIVGVCVSRAFWADLGTPEAYLQAHGDILDRYRAHQAGACFFDREVGARAARLRSRVGIEGFAALGKDVRVGPGAVLSRAVIWDGARVAAGSTITDAVIGARTVVRGKVRRMAVGCRAIPDPVLRLVLDRLGWAPSETVAMPLPPRGSSRSFVRLRHGPSSVILIRYSLERAENGLYASHARFLRRIHIPVPAVRLDLPSHHAVVVEDLGDQSLLDFTQSASGPNIERMYRRVLDAALVLHRRGTAEARKARLTLATPMPPEFYAWEHDLFARHFLCGFMRMEPARIRPIVHDLRRVAAVLSSAPSVLIHRDLQSTNVLLRDGSPHFIDFQGMRYAPAAYDVASLLGDPYVQLPLPLQRRLLAYYAFRAPGQYSETLFWNALVQRLTQALGAYARLSESAETRRFSVHVPCALRMLGRALSRVPPLPHLEDLVASATEHG
jgi:NDP-sugar pyrophosphorylase family protein/aminoglycoside/choline kinase family phosphotransferase